MSLPSRSELSAKMYKLDAGETDQPSEEKRHSERPLALSTTQIRVRSYRKRRGRTRSSCLGPPSCGSHSDFRSRGVMLPLPTHQAICHRAPLPPETGKRLPATCQAPWPAAGHRVAPAWTPRLPGWRVLM